MKLLTRSTCEVPGCVVRYYARVAMDDGSIIEFAADKALKDAEWLAKAAEYITATETARPTQKQVVEAELRLAESHYATATTELAKLSTKEQSEVKAASPTLTRLTALDLIAVAL